MLACEEEAQRTLLLRSLAKDVEVCVAIPLLQYAPITQNARVAALRVASDEVPRSYSMDIAMDAENLYNLRSTFRARSRQGRPSRIVGSVQVCAEPTQHSHDFHMAARARE